MPCYDVVNLVTLTKPNLIHEMPCGYGTLRTTAVRILPKSPAELRRSLKVLLICQLLQNFSIL
jgi:hypothetical protein